MNDNGFDLGTALLALPAETKARLIGNWLGEDERQKLEDNIENPCKIHSLHIGIDRARNEFWTPVP